MLKLIIAPPFYGVSRTGLHLAQADFFFLRTIKMPSTTTNAIAATTRTIMDVSIEISSFLQVILRIPEYRPIPSCEGWAGFQCARPARPRPMLNTAGASSTINMLGKINRTNGKIILTVVFAAISSAR